MSPYDVLGIGSPILDYIIHIPEDFLQQVPGKKGGMEPIDLDTLHKMIKLAGTPIITPGGSCSNTMIGLAHLGFQPALIGVIGRDEAAQHYLSFIQKLKIKPLFQTSDSKTSQVVSLVTPDGERTCRSYLGASQDIQIDKITPELFKDVKLVHIEGYSLLQGLLPEKAMHLAKEAGAQISFDLASFELVEHYKERILFLLSHYVDIAFSNDLEIKSLTGSDGEKGCQYLKDLCRIAVVKQGSKGCWVGQGPSLVYQPVEAVKVVDSTAAGDLFASGFLGAYFNGKPLEECARIGNLLGAAAVQVHGTIIPQETWDQIKRLLA